jgi:hypothetical protein
MQFSLQMATERCFADAKGFCNLTEIVLQAMEWINGKLFQSEVYTISYTTTDSKYLEVIFVAFASGGKTRRFHGPGRNFTRNLSHFAFDWRLQIEFIVLRSYLN